MNEAMLQLVEVSKSFGHELAIIEVLKHVNITFKQENTYAITGVSGIGKSTLLSILGGLEAPSKGKVLFNNKNIATFSVKEKSAFLNKYIGFVFQFPYLLNELTVLENVMLKGLIAGMNPVVAKNNGITLLEQAALSDKSVAYPPELSGGQQQRVAILRAIFNKPLFLLADEPTGNLDEKTGKSILDMLLGYQKSWNMGLIISSHDPLIAQNMQTVLQITEGNLIKK